MSKNINKLIFRISACIAGVIFLILLMLLIFHYAPFYLPSYTAWTGIVITIAGIISVIRPIRFLLKRSRLRGLIFLIAGMILILSAIFWPVSITHITGSNQRLDDFLNEFQCREYHESIVNASIDRVVEASLNVSFADIAAVKFLFRVRALFSGDSDYVLFERKTPVLELITQPGSGFLILDMSDPRELVFGMAGRPWSSEPPPRVNTPDEFLAFSAPGQMRVASNIKMEEVKPGLVRLSTETRNLGNDKNGRRVFARYWAIIYPGSAIIRRVWLDAIASRAEADI